MNFCSRDVLFFEGGVPDNIFVEKTRLEWKHLGNEPAAIVNFVGYLNICTNLKPTSLYGFVQICKKRPHKVYYGQSYVLRVDLRLQIPP